MATGTVKVWSQRQGSGWIAPDGGGDRVYVHKSGVERTGSGQAPRLEVGQRVDYQVGQRAKGSAAINVRPATADAAAAATPEIAQADTPIEVAVAADEG